MMTSTEILSELKNANFTTEQATVITKIFEERQQELATTSDVDSAKNELNTKIDSTKSDLNTKIDSAKSDLNAKIDSAKSELEIKIDSARNELRAEIRAVRMEMIAEISKVKYDLVRWIVGALIFNVGLVASLMFAMFKLFLDK